MQVNFNDYRRKVTEAFNRLSTTLAGARRDGILGIHQSYIEEQHEELRGLLGTLNCMESECEGFGAMDERVVLYPLDEAIVE